MSTLDPLMDDCFSHQKGLLLHDDAIAMLAERLGPVAGMETVHLGDALGRYAAENVSAPRNVPSKDNSAVDGFAFAYSDYAQSRKLKLGPRIAAGDAGDPSLPAGTAARIFTGAVVPDGADTIAMQEHCTVSDDASTVMLADGLEKGANRRLSGEDVTAGSLLISHSHLLRPQDIAALASVGIAQLSVFKRLRIAIASTGNELMDVAAAASTASVQTFDTNRPMLKALCNDLPIEITDLGILRDDADAVATTLSQAARNNDIILTSGGASSSDADHIVRTIDRLGKRHLWKIAIKPGRPMTFGQIGDCVLLGLPGNPVAAFVCFLLYFRPAVRILGGGGYREPVRLLVPAGFRIAEKKTGRREFLRGWLEADRRIGTVARKFEPDGSGLITGLRKADGLIELDENTRTVAPGDRVTYLPFSQFGISGG
ncbi:MAG: gephyrin-like molybdotransferase Glp [Pseudomonadota bacterium]